MAKAKPTDASADVSVPPVILHAAKRQKIGNKVSLASRLAQFYAAGK
jgi:hypothetical protein